MLGPEDCITQLLTCTYRGFVMGSALFVLTCNVSIFSWVLKVGTKIVSPDDEWIKVDLNLRMPLGTQLRCWPLEK